MTIVAWAGVGKSTLVSAWLRRLATEGYGSAERVFGWSFYRQGTRRDASSADEFLDAALAWFDDPDPRLGTAWEKGERLARLVARRRTLFILDGLEPLQHETGLNWRRRGGCYIPVRFLTKLRRPSRSEISGEIAAFGDPTA